MRLAGYAAQSTAKADLVGMVFCSPERSRRVLADIMDVIHEDGKKCKMNVQWTGTDLVRGGGGASLSHYVFVRCTLDTPSKGMKGQGNMCIALAFTSCVQVVDGRYTELGSLNSNSVPPLLMSHLTSVVSLALRGNAAVGKIPYSQSFIRWSCTQVPRKKAET